MASAVALDGTEIEVAAPPTHLASSNVKELISGSVGGAVATVIEYPFDTIKVRLQEDAHRYANGIACIKEIVRKEGVVNGLFRGLPAPVVGAAIENAVLFSTYRAAIEMVQDVLYGVRMPYDAEPYTAVALAAAIGGICVSQVLTPAELVKCKMQIQNTLPEEVRVYRNSMHCCLSIFQRSGLGGLFRGHVAMMYREAIGCAAYFCTFEAVVRSLLGDNQNFNEASAFVHFLGGGCAGVAFWTSIYPIDALKTKLQTHKAEYNGLSVRKGMALLYKREGMRGFTRGYAVTAARAFPGNAVLLAVYEYVSYLCDLNTACRTASLRSATCVGST